MTNSSNFFHSTEPPANLATGLETHQNSSSRSAYPMGLVILKNGFILDLPRTSGQDILQTSGPRGDGMAESRKVSIYKWLVVIPGQKINVSTMRTEQNLNSSWSQSTWSLSPILHVYGWTEVQGRKKKKILKKISENFPDQTRKECSCPQTSLPKGNQLLLSPGRLALGGAYN